MNNTSTEYLASDAAAIIAEQQKTIQMMAEALDFIYLACGYVFSHGVSDTPYPPLEGGGPQIKPCSTKELGEVLWSISAKARTALDQSGVDIVDIGRMAREKSAAKTQNGDPELAALRLLFADLWGCLTEEVCSMDHETFRRRAVVRGLCHDVPYDPKKHGTFDDGAWLADPSEGEGWCELTELGASALKGAKESADV